MISNILFVYPDAEQDYYETLRDTLRENFQNDNTVPKVIVERNLARAIEYIQADNEFDCDLIVAHIEFPLNQKLGPDPRAGLQLERWLRDNNINVPLVIVVPKNSNELASQITHHCSMIKENNRSLSDAIINFAQDRAPPKKKLDIVLNLQSTDGKPEWDYKIRGINIPSMKNPYNGELKKLNDVILGNIVHFSEQVDEANPQQWDSRVSRLRVNLKQYLITENDQFRMDLKDALRQVENLDNTRVQFVVDEKVYPVLLEAVLSPDLDDTTDNRSDYWMEHAPLIRYISGNRVGKTLYKEEQRVPINVLIIGSDTSGGVDLIDSGKEIQLESLSSIELECSQLENHLLTLKKAGINLNKPRIIQGGSRSEIKKVLEEKKWDIVHYAGHSFYDEITHNAYVFFNDNEGYATAVKIEDFARYLRNTRLLVLSSCTSAHQGFVFELAKNQIPAVLGFRAEIEDDIAREFSLHFFKNLFVLKSVEDAFFQARKFLYEDDKSRHACTNPVLVLESVA